MDNDDIYSPHINRQDLVTILHAENEPGLARHHIDSFNNFTAEGVHQIITKLFAIKNDGMKNMLNKTPEDKEIDTISFDVRFTGAYLQPPMKVMRASGFKVPMDPYYARINNMTYSADLSVDVEAKAIAVRKDGKEITKTATIKNHRIAGIPIMVRSAYCHTYNKTKEELVQMKEDPNDEGAYFIINGGEWVIDSTENITYNHAHCHKNRHQGELSRLHFISKPGDAYENSSETILRYMSSGSITVEINSTKFSKIYIPFYIIYVLYGMTSDKEMAQTIVYDVSGGRDSRDLPTTTSPHVTRKMLDMIDRAFAVEDKVFGHLKTERNKDRLYDMFSTMIHTYVKNPNYKKDDNAVRFLHYDLMATIDRELLPHIGTDPSVRIKKLWYLGHMINRLLRTELGDLLPTDRDSYRNKRLHSAGVLYPKTFKKFVNVAVIMPAKNLMKKTFEDVSFSRVNLEELVRQAISQSELERALIQAITTGNKSIIKLGQQNLTNRMVSQIMNRKNPLNSVAILRTVRSPNGSSAQSKQNERADLMRRVHSTYDGYICVTKSADSGENVGIVKELAISASVSMASSSANLKLILKEDPLIKPIDKIPPYKIVGMSKVFVNGDWIGCADFGYEVAEKYHALRRAGQIDRKTTVHWEIESDEVKFWVDFGRMLRPLLIVAVNPETNEQDILLTKQHIYDLRAKRITISDLEEEGILEYISAEEQENCLIAYSIDYLRDHKYDWHPDASKRKTDKPIQFTHCEIEQAIVGLTALSSPYANHSQPVRITYQTNMGKQTCGKYALNYPYRTDKDGFLQINNEVPLIRTMVSDYIPSNGQNCIVAFYPSGYNQEDSIETNQQSRNRTTFSGSRLYMEKRKIEENEIVRTPDATLTADRKNASYEKLVKGTVQEGVLIEKNDVMIGIVVQLSKSEGSGKYEYADRSVVYDFDEPAIVEMVVDGQNAEGERFIKVKLRMYRPFIVGDKVASRAGNKGINGAFRSQGSLPFTEDGLTPDICVNPLAFPSRMVVSQIIETVAGLVCIKDGYTKDGTMFMPIGIDILVERMKELGFRDGGKRKMFNGRGEEITVDIYIGPNYYQRLQKFVIDTLRISMTGPTSAYSRQPTEGKKSKGGMRLGEMEKDTIAGHGAMDSLHEKFYMDSDGFDMYACANCGSTEVVVNPKENIYKCPNCEDVADIRKVPSAWTTNVMMKTLGALNIGMKVGLEPYVQYV